MSLTRLRGPLCVLFLVIGIFWKLVLTRQYTWLDTGDFVNQWMPWFQTASRAMRQGVFPMWDPFEWGGESLIGQMQPGVAYPFNWPFLLLCVKNGFLAIGALHWYFVLIHVLGALFFYALSRDLGRSRYASVFAAIVFACLAYMGTTDWPQLLNGAVWFPLIFLFFLRAFDPGARPEWTALSGACLGMAFLSGHHQAPVFISLTLIGCWLLLLQRHRAAGALRSAAVKLVLFGALAALVGAFQMLPAIEYGQHALRWVNVPNPVDWSTRVPYSVHEEFSLGPVSLLGIVIPGIALHTAPFIGWSATILVLVAAACCWADWRVRLFAAIAGGGLLFSLGMNNIFHGWIYALVPGVEKARNPSMAIVVFQFGAAVLAAFGFDALSLQHARCSSWLRRLRIPLIGAAALLAAVSIVLWIVQRNTILTQSGIMVSAFAALLLAALLYAAEHETIRPRTVHLFLFGILLFETGNVTGSNYQLRDNPQSRLAQLRMHADIADWLKSRKEPVRVEVDRESIAYNFGDWYGIDAFDAYLSSMTVDFFPVQGERWGRNLFGVNYYLASKPRWPDQQEVFSSVSGLKVYRNPDALPRVWSVHRILPFQDNNGLRSLGSDVTKTALLAGALPALEACPGEDRLTLASRRMNDLTIDAEMSCKGMVIAGESYFPGWRASVDDVSQPIYAADSLLRGVVVPAGKHRIVMSYRPFSVIAGFILTLTGFLAAIVAWYRVTCRAT